MNASRFSKLVSPWSLTLLVGLLYLAAVIIRAGGDPLELALIGTSFSEGDPSGTEGYDGQFFYYIAADPDPESVAPLLDVPAYRYQRILLPLLVRMFSFGNLALIPWLFPVVTLGVHVLGVYLLERLVHHLGASRWYALPYGLWLGFLLAIRLDLAETVAFALVVAAFLAYYKDQHWLAWICLGLALFAKETTAFFLAGFGLVYLVERRWRQLAGLTLVAVLPYAAFQFWLLQTFGRLGVGAGGTGASPFQWIPFKGFLEIANRSQLAFWAFLLVYLPTILLPAFWGLWASVTKWLAGEREPVVAALFLNAAIFPFLPFFLYSELHGMFRFASGVLLALLLFAAHFRIRRALNYSFLWIALNAILIGQLISG